jgi:hypothetical protein
MFLYDPCDECHHINGLCIMPFKTFEESLIPTHHENKGSEEFKQMLLRQANYMIEEGKNCNCDCHVPAKE